jgi:thymidylate synthase
MPHLRAVNVNDAFRALVGAFSEPSCNDFRTVQTTSRVGDVVQLVEPITVTYLQPLQRVLFNEARDCNPFFHLMEALWMLAGRNDVAPMAYYSSKIADIASDDGKTFNGAYGFRWRNGRAFWGAGKAGANEALSGILDQIAVVVDQLKRKPESRRVVLQMWNTADDLQQIDKTKDVCCNTNAFFLINEGRLDMTVCNRSNDLVLGMLGANVVHFSFLQEYLAACIGVEVGVYNQISNNLHVYTESFKPEDWLTDITPDYYQRVPRLNFVPLVKDPQQFDRENEVFNENWLGQDLGGKLHLDGSDYFTEPFFAKVAYPMALAFYQHKQRAYKVAFEWCSGIWADDWRMAATTWLRRRQAAYNRAKDDGVMSNPYVVNELARQEQESKDVSAE